MNIAFWLSTQLLLLSYCSLIYSSFKILSFGLYGVYLDLSLTRLYVEALTTQKEIVICAWNESLSSCVSPELTYDFIGVKREQAASISKITSYPEARWVFKGPRKNQYHFRSHVQGWFPGSLRVQLPSGAYHEAKLSWGGRLDWNSGIIDDNQPQPFLEPMMITSQSNVDQN